MIPLRYPVKHLLSVSLFILPASEFAALATNIGSKIEKILTAKQRNNLVNFSDPYCSEWQNVFVAKQP